MEPVHKLSGNALVKMVIVVKDIHESAQTFARMFGMEVPSIHEDDPNRPFAPDPDAKQYTLYRGDQIPGRLKITGFQFGSVLVELIQPYDEPNAWNEFAKAHGTGVQSITFTVEGLQGSMAFMEQLGMPMFHIGEYGEFRYSYYESKDKLGVTVGLQEYGPK